MQNHSFSFQFLWDSTFGSYTFWSKSKCSLLIFSVLDVKSNQPTYYTFSKHSTRCKCKPAIHWITSNGFNMSKNEKEQTKKKTASERTNKPMAFQSELIYIFHLLFHIPCISIILQNCMLYALVKFTYVIREYSSYIVLQRI